jgi:Protein of unknown function (DUF4231)
LSDVTSAEKEKKALENELMRWSKWANRGSKAWSFVYHLSFGLAAVLGVIVVVISGQKLLANGYHDLLISILSGFAAVLTTIGGFGGFERKWRTNRRTRAALELLRIDLSNPKSNIADIRNRFKTIIETHEAGIMDGDQPVPRSGG